MGFFDITQRALSQGRSVFYGELFEVGFTSGVRYYWDGFGPLVAYGHTYLGAANVVARSEIPFGVDDEAGDLTLTMSGVDAALLALVRAEEAEIYGRPLTIWGQFFNEDLQPSGDRWQLFQGTMDVPTYSAGNVGERSITIPCEGEWTGRNTARHSLFSDKDQTTRFHGDRGLEYVYRYTFGVRRRWPHYPS
jgi:hypothetical protein